MDSFPKSTAHPSQPPARAKVPMLPSWAQKQVFCSIGQARPLFPWMPPCRTTLLHCSIDWNKKPRTCTFAMASKRRCGPAATSTLGGAVRPISPSPLLRVAAVVLPFALFRVVALVLPALQPPTHLPTRRSSGAPRWTSLVWAVPCGHRIQNVRWLSGFIPAARL